MPNYVHSTGRTNLTQNTDLHERENKDISRDLESLLHTISRRVDGDISAWFMDIRSTTEKNPNLIAAICHKIDSVRVYNHMSVR